MFISRRSQLLQRLDHLLEWSSVRKAKLIIQLLLAIFLQYFAFHVYEMVYPYRYVNYNELVAMTQVHLLLISCCLVLILISQLLERKGLNPKIFPRICLHFYALSLIYLAYMTGLWSMPVGLVLAGGPLFGLILFERAHVFQAVIVALLALAGLSVATALQWLDYAPLFDPQMWTAPDAKWFVFGCMVYFAAPHFLSTVLLSDMLLLHWRRREELIQFASMHDSLTGLYNRRALTDALVMRYQQVRQTQQELSVILLDIDHFKRINDSFGHAMGDEALKITSQCLRQCVREDDVVGRYGGEEFLIVLPNTHLMEAAQIAERCRSQLEQVLLHNQHSERVVLRASFGVYATGIPPKHNIDDMMKEVDHALYAAKNKGRNCVHLAAN